MSGQGQSPKECDNALPGNVYRTPREAEIHECGEMVEFVFCVLQTKQTYQQNIHNPTSKIIYQN
jgi:hypothetical protein